MASSPPDAGRRFGCRELSLASDWARTVWAPDRFVVCEGRTSSRHASGPGSNERKRIAARRTATHCGACRWVSCIPVVHPLVFAFAFTGPFLVVFLLFLPLPLDSLVVGFGRGCETATMSCRTEEYSCCASFRFQFSSLTSW